MKRPILHFFYLLYCVEAGIFLFLAPWSVLWFRISLSQVPALREILMTGQVRGGVSAMGILLLLAGMIDFIEYCRVLRES